MEQIQTIVERSFEASNNINIRMLSMSEVKDSSKYKEELKISHKG